MKIAARHYHDVVDAHRVTRTLADVLLGGQDGLVNVLGVLLGVAAATSSVRIVLVAALATALAESISMAAVAYTSSVAEGERFRSEVAREKRHVDVVPDLERDEIRELYARKGFSGELLDRVVDTITRDKDVWVAVMMAEEHGLHEVDRRSSFVSAIVVGLSALGGSLIPVVPFFVVSVPLASRIAVVIGAVTLFAFGAYKAQVTVGHPVRSGIELALVGTISALLCYGLGALLHAVP